MEHTHSDWAAVHFWRINDMSEIAYIQYTDNIIEHYGENKLHLSHFT